MNQAFFIPSERDAEEGFLKRREEFGSHDCAGLLLLLFFSFFGYRISRVSLALQTGLKLTDPLVSAS